MKIAVTGASGFVGSHLVPYLTKNGHAARTISREALPRVETYRGCDAVIHLAGLASRKAKPVDLQEANARLALNVGRASRDAGVKRFVFVSTAYAAAPSDPYALSKANAENVLLHMDGLHATVARPPLVYGAGVKGNLRSLTRLALSGYPLPFGAVNNRRSMVSVSNLCDALQFLVEAGPQVEGEIFNVMDRRAISLAFMLRTIREAVGLPPRLIPVPAWLLGTLLWPIQDQILGDQIFDGSALYDDGWEPPFNATQDIVAMARAVAPRRSGGRRTPA